MENITGNEPAYPTLEQGQYKEQWNTVAGLNIRQHFAAMAMAALIPVWVEGTGDKTHEKVLVADAVKISDALIEELNKPKSIQ